MLRFMTAGESHGKALSVIIEGLPAGIEMSEARINQKLQRRQGGYGRGGRMAIETDRVEFLSGLRGSITLGTPLSLIINNKDWSNWQNHMDPIDKNYSRDKEVTRPRPGHADLTGALKYRQTDIRNILERASARETAARVAIGAVAQEYLGHLGITIEGQVVGIGAITADIKPAIYGPKLYETSLFCPDPQATETMKKAIDQAAQNGDSLGGIFQIVGEGLPPGLGSHVHWDRRIDGLLAQVLMSIPAIKGVEIGLGFEAASLPGSEVHDEIFHDLQRGFYHLKNSAGGLEGGMTNGETLVIRGAMKPIPTLMKPLRSVDLNSKELFLAAVERSDVCAVPAAAIVGEAGVAWVVAQLAQEKFGGDHIDETLYNYKGYLDYLQKRNSK